MKRIVNVVAIFILFCVLTGCAQPQDQHQQTTKEPQPTQLERSDTTGREPPLGVDTIYDLNWAQDVGYYEGDILPEKEVAEAVAQQIFDSIKEEYGKQDYVLRYSTYYKAQDAWMINFAKPHNEGELYTMGGDCTIALSKKDGRVMRIFWGE